jgi:hypothetical protein
MKLEFDDVSELDEFLKFFGIDMAVARKRVLTAPAMTYGHIDADFALTPETAATLRAMHGGDLSTPIESAAAGDTEDPAPPVATEPEPPRRKRRTKAEIEAEKNANPFSQPSATAGAALTAEPGDTALTAAAQGREPHEEALDNQQGARVSAETVANVGENLAPVVEAAQELGRAMLAAGTQTPDIWIKQRARELDSVDPIAHMTLCRNFIHKLGMPKYGETFKLTGLSENVMSYDNAQRALHAAALEFVDKHVA